MADDSNGFLAWLATDPGKAALAGALGGVVRWITLRDDWREGVPGIVVGGVCAMYLGPLVEPVIEPVIGGVAPGSDAAGFAAFMVGLGGIGLSAALIDLLQAWRHRAERPRSGGGGDAQS